MLIGEIKVRKVGQERKGSWKPMRVSVRESRLHLDPAEVLGLFQLEVRKEAFMFSYCTVFGSVALPIG